MPIIEIQKQNGTHACLHVRCPARAALEVNERNPFGGSFSQDEMVSITSCLAKYIGGDGFCDHFVKMNREHLWCSCNG